MRNQLLSFAMLCLACGRTAPIHDGFEAAMEGAGHGLAPSAMVSQPIFVDLTGAVATGHALDGTVVFQTHVLPTRGHLQPRLFAGGALLGWLERDEAIDENVFGVLRSDGSSAFFNQQLDPGDAWLDNGAVVLSNSTRGLVASASSTTMLTLRPFQGATTAGAVPCLDVQERFVWLDPKTGATRAVTQTTLPTRNATERDDAVYFAIAEQVTESTVGLDTTLSTGFSLPQLIAVAGRKALVLDTVPSQLAVVDFAAQQVNLVTVTSPHMTALELGPGLFLDDEAWVYAPFFARPNVVMARTKDFGATWSIVFTMPVTPNVFALEARRFGDTLLVLGTEGFSSIVTWRSAALVDLHDGTKVDLPLGRQITLPGVLPVAVTNNGAFAAFWSVTGDQISLERTSMATRETKAIETRPLPSDPLIPTGLLPPLEWME